MDGWAVEARVYAEDPSRNFMPSIGRLVRYLEPASAQAFGLKTHPSVRVDSGVVEGSEISMFYDPMIAKVIAYGETRNDAIAELQAALDAFHIHGIKHNIPFLAAVMAHPRFRDGRLTTNFITEAFPDGFHGRDLADDERDTLVAVATFLQRRQAERELAVSGQIDGHGAPPGADWVVIAGDESLPRAVQPIVGGLRVTGGPADLTVESAWRIGEPLFRGRVDGQPVTVQVARRGPSWRLTHGGATLEVLVLRPRAAELASRMLKKAPPDQSRFLLSPMPGLLVSLAVEEGQDVEAGEALAVVEAMKMENVLRAERDGLVAKIHVRPGDSLAVDQSILEFE
jgi:propionyl-CoA carboxylase alpha chain